MTRLLWLQRTWPGHFASDKDGRFLDLLDEGLFFTEIELFDFIGKGWAKKSYSLGRRIFRQFFSDFPGFFRVMIC